MIDITRPENFIPIENDHAHIIPTVPVKFVGTEGHLINVCKTPDKKNNLRQPGETSEFPIDRELDEYLLNDFESKICNSSVIPNPSIDPKGFLNDMQDMQLDVASHSEFTESHANWESFFHQEERNSTPLAQQKQEENIVPNSPYQTEATFQTIIPAGSPFKPNEWQLKLKRNLESLEGYLRKNMEESNIEEENKPVEMQFGNVVMDEAESKSRHTFHECNELAEDDAEKEFDEDPLAQLYERVTKLESHVQKLFSVVQEIALNK
ncbi:hypothetical protein O9G_004094 [Rozella allomycis CSF55]|uniref:Uncharacterized protein n=1 Tax=Rozella allomycis (strain CSF55) TaxID=988480 RepID=A0A075ARF0_ROZAC|nr:hypothetical protein O9G_004094 [Rozella allomycis CSF55]|eukprot:EPZ32823.1 hypothetical protein O9G_004094 [Rozella allomycis CSF55]